jgi:hypothetical protein
LALIKDLAGYGTANFFEGTAAAPALSTTVADFRGGNGCTETDDNSADFLTGAPGPRNTASPTGVCTTGAENIVISQVYGGGGNSSPDAQYTHDYVELFNLGSSAVNLAGWSIQYASATGTGTFGGNANMLTELSGTLQPGQYLLVQEGTVMTSPLGSPLPAPDITDATPIGISSASGKVVLANTTLPLGCNGGSAACSPGALASIVDLVGYGIADYFEGAGAAPGLTNILADFRNNDGCTDTDNNSADFTAAAPTPRNTASAFNLCPGNDTAPSVIGTSPADNDTNVAANAVVTVTFDEAVTITGTVPIVCGANPAEDVTPTTSDNLTYTLPHADFPAGETCTVTIDSAQVSDNDTDDPPDGLAADFVFDFSVLSPTVAQVFTAAAAGTADNDTEPDVAYQTGDVLRWDGVAWTKFFDGTDSGLPASADIIALDVIDPNRGSLYLVWRQNLTRVPDVNNGAPGRVSPWEVVAFDGAAFTRFFDARDVGLTLFGERINGLDVLPGNVAPINGGNCQAYLLISTMAGGAVRNGTDPVIKFTGEDVLGFCMLTGGANSSGLWHLAFEGQGNGLVKNSTLGLAASDDALTLYFTSKKSYPAGVNKVLPFAQPSGPLGAPLFDAKAAGLVKLVDSIDYIP